MSSISAGIGTDKPKIVLHIANRPELDTFQDDGFITLQQGEAAQIIKLTSNHWRKVFSIMAKLSFALFKTGCTTWQEYRDTILLTEQGFEAIDFSPITQPTHPDTIHIVCGFAYAESQLDFSEFVPHAFQPKLLGHTSQNCFVTPYFDWRQLNNEILEHLIQIVSARLTTS